MKNFRIGKMNVDTKSALFGVLVCMVGLSLPLTSKTFGGVLETVQTFFAKIFGKKVVKNSVGVKSGGIFRKTPQSVIDAK